MNPTSWITHRLLLGALAFLTSSSLFAASGSGTEAASFLDIPVGARPAALGGAYTALAEDAYSPVWNPAGVAFNDQLQLAGQHLSYLESIHYEYAGVVIPFRSNRQSGEVRHGMGASIQYLGTGDMTGRDRNGGLTGDFSSHYAAYSLTYAHRIGSKGAIGLTGKWINAKISDVGADAQAVDVGSLYRATDRLTLGASLVNLGSELKFLQDGGDLPLAVKAGAAYRIGRSWLFAAEGVHRKTGLTSGHVGAEWMPLSLISVRAGYRTDISKELSAISGLSAGMGLHLWGQEFAYAWVPYGELGNTQYFSLLARFGTAAEEKRNLIQFRSIRQHQNASQKKNPYSLDDSDPQFIQILQLLDDMKAPVAAAPVPTETGSR